MSVSTLHVFIGILLITCTSCQKWFNVTEEFMVIPNNNGNGVVVKLQLELSQVIADAMAMSVEMHHSMNLRWQDDRFIRQGSTDPHKTYINMYGTDPDFEFVWVPDVYMTNEVPSGILDYQPTDIIRIYENGTLLLSKQHVVMFYCKLRLFKVPMTNEICSIQFQSNAYSEEEMDLDWFYNPPVTFSKDYVSLVSKIANTMTETCEGGEIAPNELRPCIQLNIEVEQVYKGFIVQVYLPSSAILFMLWLGFWLNFKEVSARIRIVSVAFTLTVTQMVGVMIVFPDIVELEPLVVWNAFCLGMNILAFIEFLVVHNMYMNIQLKKAQSQELTVTPSPSSTVSMQSKNMVKRIQVQPMSGDLDPEDLGRRRKRHRPPCITPDTVDKMCMVAFIFIFITFNIVYWTTFMHFDL